MTLRTTIITKVVQAMKKLQASYNEATNIIVKGEAQEKKCKTKFEFLMDLAIFAMVEEDTKPTKDKPHTFSKAWNHPNVESQRKRAGTKNHGRATRLIVLQSEIFKGLKEGMVRTVPC